MWVLCQGGGVYFEAGLFLTAKAILHFLILILS